MKSHNPVQCCANRSFPVLFIHGVDDTLIAVEHTEKLFDAYSSQDKDAIYVEGGHNDQRSNETNKQIYDFLVKKLF